MADRATLIIGLLWALTIVAVIVVTARLVVRHKIGGIFWEDWLMLAALVFQLIDMGFLSASSSWGLGKHDYDMTPEQLINSGKWAWLYMIPGTFVAVLARVSAGIFLIRLFGVHTWLRRYLIVFTVLQVIGGILVLFTNFLAIAPVEALWDPTIPGARARYSTSVASITAYTTQALFTTADLTYVLFPVMIIWSLQLSVKKKAILILLMCTSLITMGVSIMKAITIAHVSGVAEPAYTSSLSALWAGLEQTLVIIMASVPTLSAAAKLNLGIRRLTSSLAKSLARSVGRSNLDSKNSKVRNSSGDSTAAIKLAQYSNLDKSSLRSHNSSHNSHPGSCSQEESICNAVGTTIAYYQQSSKTSLTKLGVGGHVRRTDEYFVEYTPRK